MALTFCTSTFSAFVTVSATPLRQLNVVCLKLMVCHLPMGTSPRGARACSTNVSIGKSPLMTTTQRKREMESVVSFPHIVSILVSLLFSLWYLLLILVIQLSLIVINSYSNSVTVFTITTSTLPHAAPPHLNSKTLIIKQSLYIQIYYITMHNISKIVTDTVS